MSTPEEEIYAVRRTFDFLKRLGSGEIKRVPAAVREEALRLFRHFPGPTAMEIFWHRDRDCSRFEPREDGR